MAAHMTSPLRLPSNEEWTEIPYHRSLPVTWAPYRGRPLDIYRSWGYIVSSAHDVPMLNGNLSDYLEVRRMCFKACDEGLILHINPGP